MLSLFRSRGLMMKKVVKKVGFFSKAGSTTATNPPSSSKMKFFDFDFWNKATQVIWPPEYPEEENPEDFMFSDKDLISEESMWDAYERFLVHHRVDSTCRPLDKKLHYFNNFKASLLSFHAYNKKNPSSPPLGLSLLEEMDPDGGPVRYIDKPASILGMDPCLLYLKKDLKDDLDDDELAQMGLDRTQFNKIRFHLNSPLAT